MTRPILEDTSYAALLSLADTADSFTGGQWRLWEPLPLTWKPGCHLPPPECWKRGKR